MNKNSILLLVVGMLVGISMTLIVVLGVMFFRNKSSQDELPTYVSSEKNQEQKDEIFESVTESVTEASEAMQESEETEAPVVESDKKESSSTEKEEREEKREETDEKDSVKEEIPVNNKLVVIDAGHQKRGNNEQEPVGPGASQKKAKVSSGTAGVSTKRPEYEVTLEVALKLQKELETRGYTVIMVRTMNDVNISNAERATVANDANADAFIRIHIDGSEDSSVTGAHTICQTPSNPYNGDLYQESKALALAVLQEYTAATGCKQRIGGDGVSERDDLSGINWCKVPTTLIELGFMTNPTEDQLLSSEDYQDKMAKGIANGIDKYFAE